MTTKQVCKALENVEYGEEFEVTLKTGETVVCKCDPEKTECEAAYQQTLNKETLYRGDLIKAAEICAI